MADRVVKIASGGETLRPTRKGKVPITRRILTLNLTDRLEELSAEMLAPTRFAVLGAHGMWLLDRYREILPVILPDTLRCVETGSKLDQSSLALIRASAFAMQDTKVPLSIMLRGGVPALRVFSAFMYTRDSGLSAADLTVLMGRAALIAGELGAYWVEAWADARSQADADRLATDGDSLDLVATPGSVESPALEMLALVAAGRSNEQIAEATDYSMQAVKWHLARVMRTWKVDTRAALVSVALLRGVLVARRGRLSPFD